MVACPDRVRVEPGAGRGRLNQDDPDAESSHFPPQRLAEAGDRVLGRRVVGSAGHGEPAVYRGDVDDPAVALGAHPGQYQLS